MDGNMKYQQKIDHLKSGYDNLQSVVRFLDTKALAVVAGVTTVFGLTVTLMKWYFSFLFEYRDHIKGWCGCWNLAPLAVFLTMVVMLWFLLLSLYHAYKTLVPRNTGNSAPSAIFPVIPTAPKGTKLKEKDAKFAEMQEQRIELYLGNPTEIDALEDYTEQLKQMGRINNLKLNHCKLAISNIFPLILSSGLVAVLVVLNWVLFKGF